MLELQQFVLQQMRLRLGAVTLAGTMRAFLPGAREVDERRWGGAEHGRTRACTSGWVRVFLPFALGYYLSYLLRTVNAVISPRLAAKDRSLMATRPPKRMVRCSTVRICLFADEEAFISHAPLL